MSAAALHESAWPFAHTSDTTRRGAARRAPSEPSGSEQRWRLRFDWRTPEGQAAVNFARCPAASIALSIAQEALATQPGGVQLELVAVSAQACGSDEWIPITASTTSLTTPST